MRRLNDKVFCQCEIGQCFLDDDAAWCRQNIVKSENGFCRDEGLFNSLEAERLRQKGEWMDRLDVAGTRQICCRRKIDRLLSNA